MTFRPYFLNYFRNDMYSRFDHILSENNNPIVKSNISVAVSIALRIQCSEMLKDEELWVILDVVVEMC